MFHYNNYDTKIKHIKDKLKFYAVITVNASM